MTRDDSWTRTREPGERFVRFSVDVPPELAGQLDAAVRKSLGVNQSAFSRANSTRSALRLLLNTLAPEPPEAIEGTAIDVSKDTIKFLTAGDLT